MRKTGLVALALVPALALARGEATGERAQQMEGAGERQQQQIGEELQRSLQRLHAANQAEVELGRLAQEQAESQQVRELAQRMVTDHQRGDERLTQAAQDMGVNLQGDEYQSAMEESREKMDELREKRGAEFDRAYTEHLVQEHDRNVQEVREAAATAREQGHTELATLLGQTEGGLHQHHTLAQQIHEQVQQQARAPQQQFEELVEAQLAPEVTGSVESIEQDSLVLRDQLGETHRLTLDPDTTYLRLGELISRGQIGEGDYIRATFDEDLRATEVTVVQSGYGTEWQHMYP
jgi:putative membrane protein